MSPPTNNTTTYSINTPYRNIEAKIISKEKNLTIVQGYKDLANIIKTGKKNNWAEINLTLHAELQNTKHPKQRIITNLPNTWRNNVPYSTTSEGKTQMTLNKFQNTSNK